jgi:hypothetical protein
VDQGRGLERLAGRLLGQSVGRELAQLIVDQRQELLGGVGVALLLRALVCGQEAVGVYKECSLFTDKGLEASRFPEKPII